jgi:hypothetical protein
MYRTRRFMQAPPSSESSLVGAEEKELKTAYKQRGPCTHARTRASHKDCQHVTPTQDPWIKERQQKTGRKGKMRKHEMNKNISRRGDKKRMDKN